MKSLWQSICVVLFKYNRFYKKNSFGGGGGAGALLGAERFIIKYVQKEGASLLVTEPVSTVY